MRQGSTSLVLGLAAIAAILFSGAVFAKRPEFDPEYNPEGVPETPMGDAVNDASEDSDDTDDAPDGIVSTTPSIARSAFLYMLRSCEHAAAAVADDTAYQTFYGGSLFWDVSDHPVITGEKSGVPLPAPMCIAAGYADGVCVSTAAGAYQFTKPTWLALKKRGNLPDFTPESQDAAALLLLDEIGALSKIDSGDLDGAIKKASTRWASLPYSTAQQHPRSLEFAVARFNEAAATLNDNA